jgi:hypothetical protein
MFGTMGVVTTPIGSGDDSAFALVQEADGKLVAGGSSSNGTNLDFTLVRYDAGGTPDPGFGTGGIVTTPLGTGDDAVAGLLVQPNGGLVAAGYAVSGAKQFALARYLTLTTPTTATTTSVTTTTGPTTTTTLVSSLVPGGPSTKTNNDCYLELKVDGIAPGSGQVQKNQVVACTDGDPCDQGPCGDNRCDVQIAACASQSDPALPDCTPPASLDAVKIGGGVNVSTADLRAGPSCTPPFQVAVSVKLNKKGKYQAGKSKVVIKGNAKAPKGVSPRKDTDKWTIQCMPRTAACPQ